MQRKKTSNRSKMSYIKAIFAYYDIFLPVRDPDECVLVDVTDVASVEKAVFVHN